MRKVLFSLALAFVASVTSAMASPVVTYIGWAFGASPICSNTTVTINVPSGTVNGDLLLAYIETHTATGNWLTAPSGWTQVVKTYNGPQGGQLWYKFANNEPASYAWSGSGSSEGIIKAYRYVSMSDPIRTNGTCGSTSAGNCIIPALTGAQTAGELYAAFWGFNTPGAQLTTDGNLGNLFTDNTVFSVVAGDKWSWVNTNASENVGTYAPYAAWDAIAVILTPCTSC